MTPAEFCANMATLDNWVWLEMENDWRLQWPGIQITRSLPADYSAVVPGHAIVRVYLTNTGSCAIDTAATAQTTGWEDVVSPKTAWGLVCANELLLRACIMEAANATSC